MPSTGPAAARYDAPPVELAETELETGIPVSSESAPKQPRQNRQQAASERSQVSKHPPTGHSRADGQRWLTTTQAIALSKARGGPDNKGTLKRWGEDGQLDAIGLRYCPHGTKRNDLASFEDLRWGG